MTLTVHIASNRARLIKVAIKSLDLLLTNKKSKRFQFQNLFIIQTAFLKMSSDNLLASQI